MYVAKERIIRNGRLIAYAGETMTDEEARRRGLDAVEPPDSMEEEPNYRAMTVREIKAVLDARGVAYPKRAKRSELLKLVE